MKTSQQFQYKPKDVSVTLVLPPPPATKGDIFPFRPGEPMVGDLQQAAGGLNKYACQMFLAMSRISNICRHKTP